MEDDGTTSASTPADRRRFALRLFALSFTALFLELLVIRWAPAVVRLIAYYANLMLISSFLGLGLGAMLATAKRRWIGWFPAFLLLEIGLLLVARSATLPGSAEEFRFFLAEGSALLNHLILVVLFLANVLPFVPLGQEVGRLFHKLPTLTAYGWDLGGSLAGSVLFGLFSYHMFSPTIGMAAVMLAVLVLLEGRQRLVALPLFAVTLLAFIPLHSEERIWSPYYHVRYSLALQEEETPEQVARREQRAEESERARREVDFEASGTPTQALRDADEDVPPPLYVVSVNRDFYQLHGTIALERYPEGAPHRDRIRSVRDQYLLRHALIPEAEDVLILGAGGGMDVEGALLAGAEHVDAVEIDPELVALSRRLNVADPYGDPRVTVHVDDARAYLEQTDETYDLVAFGLLDSQALFSSMSNLRLDGFTYTVEGFRAAWRRVRDGGMFSVTFATGRTWLVPKLVGMVREATGRTPVLYQSGAYILVCVPRFELDPPERFGTYHLIDADEVATSDVPLATDDWPFLYLSTRTVPDDYVTVIVTLLIVSVLAVLRLRGRSLGIDDGHFFFMGVGFLLLQTKTIGDSALYLGSTWFVTMLVIAGVLVMMLAANALALRLQFSRWLYAPLLAALVVVSVVSRSWVLTLPFEGRVAWVALVLTLPIFFAGVIFSTTFRSAPVPSAVFGANLIGAMVGGFCEYLGMAVGSRNLMLVVFGAYVASWACMTLIGRRSG